MAPASRRGFLRGLTTLPLIGGSVTLLGNPSAADVTVTPGMIATYLAWLHYEQRYLQWAVDSRGFVPLMNPGACFHEAERGMGQAGLQAIQRAPVVLSAVGCRLTSAEAERHESYFGRDNWQEAVRCA